MKIEHKRKEEQRLENYSMLCDGDIFSPIDESDNLFIKTDEGNCVRLATGVLCDEFSNEEIVNVRTDEYLLIHKSHFPEGLK